MIDILDQFFETQISNLATSLPDGMVKVDLPLLTEMNLLDELTSEIPSKHLPQCMAVVETDTRVTLYNDFFAAWIVPQNKETGPETLLLIATLHDNVPTLEIGYLFRGVHNQARTILQVLDKTIEDINETNKELAHIITEEH